MTGVFREGHNRPRPRRREPLRLGPPPNPWKKRAALGIPLLFVALAAMLFVTRDAAAHPQTVARDAILDRPIAGVRNNYWYDYRSDVEEAQSELRKDLRRAKSYQDEREAWAEYHRELRDARADYRKEMIEKGYILRRGIVTVGG